MVVVLPAPLTPADHDHRRAAGGIADRLGGLGQHRLELHLDLLDHVVHVDDAGAEVRADLVGDLLRGLHAHVGLDEHVEHVVDELVVDQLALPA